MMQNKGCAGTVDMGNLVFQEVVIFFSSCEGLNLGW